MERDETPLWAQELLQFTEFGLSGVTAKIEQLERSTVAFESHITRKIEAMELHIVERLENLEIDVAALKARST
ncbi:MAG: hypothetical protein IAI50_20430 [Candidatus Eremiobacteraeota bacterium]|nr:hypothetical protein [Candidatus Eremiobacteraeota bacterium]